MRKKLIALSLCSCCLLNAGVLEDAKNKVIESVNENINKNVDSAKEKLNDYNKEKDEKKKEKLNLCVEEIKTDLPKYALFLEQYYLKTNKNAEDKLLSSYEQLKKEGISTELKAFVDEGLLEKLSNSKSLLEYSNIILSSLKSIQEELKENDKERLDSLIKQTQFLMFAWTAPFELYSTKKVYDKSLLDITSKLFTNIDKSKYDNYSKFLYSLMISNTLNESITIKKDTALSGVAKASLYIYSFGFISPNSEDKKGLETVCTELIENTYLKEPKEIILENLASLLNIKKDLIVSEMDRISKNDNLFEGSVLFDKKNAKLEEINIISNPLQDNWYFMIREYMEIQDDFYKNKKEVDKIIEILNVLPDTENKIAILKEDIFKVDSLYRKLDELVRFNIIDLPISIYADLYANELLKAKKWYNDDEEHLSKLAVTYNQSCANLQKYMLSPVTIDKVLRVTKEMKSEFKEAEWEEVKTRAKLTQDWLNMLNKVKIENK